MHRSAARAPLLARSSAARAASAKQRPTFQETLGGLWERGAARETETAASVSCPNRLVSVHRGYKLQCAVVVDRPPLIFGEAPHLARWRSFEEAWRARTGNEVTLHDNVAFYQSGAGGAGAGTSGKLERKGAANFLETPAEYLQRQKDKARAAKGRGGAGAGAALPGVGVAADTDYENAVGVPDYLRNPEGFLYLLVKYKGTDLWTFPRVDRLVRPSTGMAMSMRGSIEDGILDRQLSGGGREDEKFNPHMAGFAPFAHESYSSGRRVFYYRARWLPPGFGKGRGLLDPVLSGSLNQVLKVGSGSASTAAGTSKLARSAAAPSSGDNGAKTTNGGGSASIPPEVQQLLDMPQYEKPCFGRVTEQLGFQRQQIKDLAAQVKKEGTGTEAGTEGGSNSGGDAQLLSGQVFDAAAAKEEAALAGLTEEARDAVRVAKDEHRIRTVFGVGEAAAAKSRKPWNFGKVCVGEKSPVAEARWVSGKQLASYLKPRTMDTVRCGVLEM